MNKPSFIFLSLFLAATLCVDAVATYWREISAGGETAFALYIGLMLGNLSGLCVWAANPRRASQFTWIVPFVAGLLIALLSSGLYESKQFMAGVLDFAGLFWIHVAGLLALLWVWNQTRFGRPLGEPPAAPPWQVSVLQLLIVTTVVAVVLTVWTSSKLIQRGSEYQLVPWVINNIVVAIAAVIILSRPWLLITRTASLVAAALVCGMLLLIVLKSVERSLGSTSFTLWQNLFHAIVLLVWIQVGGIIPAAAPRASSADE